MPFLRFSRDKRGYENFYLVQPTTNRRGKVRARILYFYRTPPDVRVGREPFDPAVRRALETQNPDVAFDWRQILETPIPSAETERWRERRRQERAERAARQSAPAEEAGADAGGGEGDTTPDADEADAGAEATKVAPESSEVVGQITAPPPPPRPASLEGGAASGAGSEAGARRRRRRRGRRGRLKFEGPTPRTSPEVELTGPPVDAVAPVEHELPGLPGEVGDIGDDAAEE
jgi:hypothetical protein